MTANILVITCSLRLLRNSTFITYTLLVINVSKEMIYIIGTLKLILTQGSKGEIARTILDPIINEVGERMM